MADEAENIAAWYEKYRKNQEERERKAIAQIRELAEKLKPFNVTKMVATYDGSGDSGDFEDISLEGTDTTDLEDVLGRIGMDRDSLADMLWPLLPSGWEINEGSYGELTLDVATGKMHRVHNQRIEDVDTTEDEV